MEVSQKPSDEQLKQQLLASLALNSIPVGSLNTSSDPLLTASTTRTAVSASSLNRRENSVVRQNINNSALSLNDSRANPSVGNSLSSSFLVAASRLVVARKKKAWRKPKLRTYLSDEKTGRYNFVKVHALDLPVDPRWIFKSKEPEPTITEEIEGENQDGPKSNEKEDGEVKSNEEPSDRQSPAEDDEEEEEEFNILTSIKNPVVEEEKKQAQELLKQQKLKKQAERKKIERVKKSLKFLKRISQPRSPTPESPSPLSAKTNFNASESLLDQLMKKGANESASHPKEPGKKRRKTNLQLEETSNTPKDSRSKHSTNRPMEQRTMTLIEEFEEASEVPDSPNSRSRLMLEDVTSIDDIRSSIEKVVEDEEDLKVSEKEDEPTNFEEQPIVPNGDTLVDGDNDIRNGRNETVLFPSKHFDSNSIRRTRSESDLSIQQSNKIQTYSSSKSIQTGSSTRARRFSEPKAGFGRRNKMSKERESSKFRLKAWNSDYDLFNRFQSDKLEKWECTFHEKKKESPDESPVLTKKKEVSHPSSQLIEKKKKPKSRIATGSINKKRSPLKRSTNYVQRNIEFIASLAKKKERNNVSTTPTQQPNVGDSYLEPSDPLTSNNSIDRRFGAEIRMHQISPIRSPDDVADASGLIIGRTEGPMLSVSSIGESRVRRAQRKLNDSRSIFEDSLSIASTPIMIADTRTYRQLRPIPSPLRKSRFDTEKNVVEAVKPSSYRGVFQLNSSEDSLNLSFDDRFAYSDSLSRHIQEPSPPKKYQGHERAGFRALQQLRRAKQNSMVSSLMSRGTKNINLGIWNARVVK